MLLLQLQAASGMALGVFLSAHLVGHVIAVASLPAANAWLHGVRAVVQAPWIELGALPLALLVHMGTSFVRTTRRWARTGGPRLPSVRELLASPWPWDRSPAAVLAWQRHTGTVLGLLLGVHTYATRIAPWLFLSPAENAALDYTVVTASFRLHPWLFHPYYLILGGAGAYHLVHGTAYGVRLLWPGRMSAHARVTGGRSVGTRLVAAAAVLAIAVALQALAGHLYPIAIPQAATLLERDYRASFGWVDERHLAAVVQGP
jgi:hypothetical protein